MIDLAAAGFSEVLPVAAEAAIMFQYPKGKLELVKNDMIHQLGDGPLAERVVAEAAGIADKLRGDYSPRTDAKPFDFSRQKT
jgi:hypothetical protein